MRTGRRVHIGGRAEREVQSVASVGFGTVKVWFNTDVELADLVAPVSGKIKVRSTSQGNTANVVAKFELADGANRTTDLTWTADVSIMGNIAGLATRLMGAALACSPVSPAVLILSGMPAVRNRVTDDFEPSLRA